MWVLPINACLLAVKSALASCKSNIFRLKRTGLLQIAKLNKALENSSVQVGDVLRGVTCTNFVYEVSISGRHPLSQACGCAE